MMISNRRQFLGQVTAFSLLPVPAKADDAVPVITGTAVQGLEAFDTCVSDLLKAHAAPGAALAIARKGRLVYSRGFGLADKDRRVAVQPKSRFRIASVSKPVTAAAILQLAERKKLSLSDKVLDHVKLKPHLADDAKMDERWPQITLRHLLHHSAGWDRGKSYDPITITPKIATALKVEYPVTPEHVCRYMMGQPLDFEPGERYAYSNLGYLLLGRVIESVTGQGYESWVKKETLAPLGIRDMQLGRALLENRAKDEVMYYDSKNRMGPALYGTEIGKRVPMPYGGQNLEAYEAHGGWIANAVDLVRFASAFDDPSRCPILKKETIDELVKRPTFEAKSEKFYGCGWNVRPGKAGPTLWHSGLIGGTSTLLIHRNDGLNWAILFNSDSSKDGKTLSGLIEPKLHEAANSIVTWPAGEPL